MSRCDSAAIVPNTSELLPDPETPVNTVSRRFGISTLRSLRLLTRAPCTRITSWPSAACSAGDRVSVLVAMLIGSPSRCRDDAGGGTEGQGSRVLDQPEDIAIGVSESGYQAAGTDVTRGLFDRGARGGHLGQLRFDVRHVPVSHR